MASESPAKLALDWVQEEFEKTRDLTTAVETAMTRVLHSGFAEALLLERGAAWLRDDWRQRQHAERAKVTREPREAAVPAGGSGPVVHDAAPLREDRASIYEALWEVDGRWIRIGDFTAQDCRYVAGQYDEKAQGNARMARLFSELGSRVGELLVRDVLSEEELRDLFAEAR